MVIRSLDIVGKEAISNPQDYFGRLRDESPVVYDERSRSWVITGYEHISAALSDTESFSSNRILPVVSSKLDDPKTDPLLKQAFTVLADWLVFKDKPDHTRLRSLIFKAFSPRAIENLKPNIIDIADEVLSSAPDEGVVELFEAVAFPITSYMISEMLGVPGDKRDQFLKWIRLVGPIVNGGFGVEDRYEMAAQAFDELLKFSKELVDFYREKPGDNLISNLIQARNDKDALSDSEILASCTLFVFGGTETTANLICNAIYLLVNNPDQMRKLRNKEVDVSSAVEEFLRYEGSGKAVTRIVSKDTDFFGHEFKAGQRVFLILASANRDPKIFENPENLVLDRQSQPRHLAFGHGAHSCLGSMLARAEANIVIPKILDRWSYIGLNEGCSIQWVEQLLARGLEKLVVDVKR